MSSGDSVMNMIERMFWVNVYIVLFMSSGVISVSRGKGCLCVGMGRLVLLRFLLR